MKKPVIITSIIIAMLLVACDDFSNESKKFQEAQEHFVSEVQYMTKEEALSNEIDYYKDPEIIVGYKVKDLTGKEVIHECNLLLKENEEAYRDLQTGKRWVVRTWNVGEAKDYAIKHPDDFCGKEYYFEGIFTHYGKGFGTRKARVLLMKSKERKKEKDNWYVIE